MRFFENHIRPLLVQQCYECHANDKAEGGLRLDVVEAISQSGESGPVVVPADPASSLLLSAVSYKGLEMPPDAPLSDQQKSDLETWITQGAYWPITKSKSSGSTQPETWWAAEPIDPSDVPEPVNGVSSSSTIDRYIDHELNVHGLTRAAGADRARLIRRLSYDLLGLPPTPEAIERFTLDDRPDAYERLVDRMIADPAYEPGPPSIFGKHDFEPAPPQESPASSGRRSALAAWIISPDNPITARVMVNRLWQYHFETGLASGANDFGRLVTPPSHPRLLDYLANCFIYLKRFRNSGDEILSALDTPPGIIGTAKRDVTTTATQSLMMLNSPRIIEMVDKFAARVRADVSSVAEPDRATQFVRHAHKILTGVEPDEETTLRLLVPWVTTGNAGEVAACHALLNSNAFLFVD